MAAREGRARAIAEAAREIVEEKHLEQFPLDVFQTGSGTSTNMNANEVIATSASRRCGKPVSANDHVNMGQSSNDTIPTAIHVSAALAVNERLIPALQHLQDAIWCKAASVGDVVKTGRTHLMDAMPIRVGQELDGWALQIGNGIDLLASVSRLLADKAITDLAVRQENLNRSLAPNPILVSALNPIVGYLKAAEIAKLAYRTGRPVIDVAGEMTGIPRGELERLLDPLRLTDGGIDTPHPGFPVL